MKRHILSDSHEKKQFFYALFIPILLGLIMVLCFGLEKGMSWHFNTAGIYPRDLKSLTGVITIIFVHADGGHLLNNLLSFLIVCGLLFVAYRAIAMKVLFISWIFSGLILWVIGRDSWHIGASGLIYALAFFLFFSGIIRKHVPLIAISMVVAFVYGNMVWHIVPWQVHDPISWEGHLSGAIVGIILAYWFRKEGPQKPIKIWDDEDIDENLYSEIDEDD